MQFEITLNPIGKTFTTLQQFADWLDFITEPAHDASEHVYEPNPDWEGTCLTCNWIHPDTNSPTGCDHTMQQHAISAYNEVRKIAQAMELFEKIDERDCLESTQM